MDLKKEINRKIILDLFELMQYYLNNISNLTAHIKYKIEELESQESNLKKDINLHRLKLKFDHSNIKLEQYKNINKEIEFKFKYSLLFRHSKKKIIISILDTYGYDQQQIIQEYKQMIGELLTCQHRLYRLIKSPEYLENLSREIKRKITQELTLHCQENQKENIKSRKTEKATLFMNIIGEIETKAYQDHFSSIVKLKELDKRIEQIFITKNTMILSSKTKEIN